MKHKSRALAGLEQMWPFSQKHLQIQHEMRAVPKGGGAGRTKTSAGTGTDGGRFKWVEASDDLWTLQQQIMGGGGQLQRDD